MKRREFVRSTATSGAWLTLNTPLALRPHIEEVTWFDRPMRWAQLVLVENDPGNFDPDFWLDYFKEIHADAACLSAGGIVAYYPTEVPLHHRSLWLGDSDPFGYLVEGCRKMGMSVIARTDPHAAWEDQMQAHPDHIMVTEAGERRRHWANPDMWVTCALGPYNFDFMTRVHEEIIQRYGIDGIFSNRWAGHGICYCKHCQENFQEYSGFELPRDHERTNPVYQKYTDWRIERLWQLWQLWDQTIRRVKATSRFIPNGFPNRLVTGENSDIFFTDHQARSGFIPPWSNGKRAKELRATMGMKPLGGIFSVGIEEKYRWKDSVQSQAELRTWVLEGTANNMRPWFAKFSGVLYDQRWLPIVRELYEWHYRNEKYLRNKKSLADVAIVYSEQTERYYGGQAWQQDFGDHENGVYHTLIEARIPFEMVHDQLLDSENLKNYRLLILPNVAALSDQQCTRIKEFVRNGGNLIATFQTSLYDEEGTKKSNFGLADLFGVDAGEEVEGPMRNSYLEINRENGQYHTVLEGLENTSRIINGIWRQKVKPVIDFPSPITLIPSYPDLPMEHVYPRETGTGIRELYLREYGRGSVAYIPWDIDRTCWQIFNTDHCRLLQNIFRWSLGDKPPVRVTGPGILDVTIWEQDRSMTVHLVNFTNPMMLKGPYREILPLGQQQVAITLSDNREVKGLKLLVSGLKPPFKVEDGIVHLTIDSILDHEVIALDF
ncbi:MAG: beta-galactosidase trimerization domain-containing protein [Saprospiraceae bacterium]|nr:beta-galactosidase trimerization domain-containing protein [Saprospiraceae bacterium]